MVWGHARRSFAWDQRDPGGSAASTIGDGAVCHGAAGHGAVGDDADRHHAGGHDPDGDHPVGDKLVERLEIRAALLATSVQTADDVELTDQAAPSNGRALR